ncbi:MAG: PQQ-dependent sugar dehydrogenase [Candidatus Nanopelagicales bacterium]
MALPVATPPPVALSFTQVGAGFEQPVQVLAAPGRLARLLVVERAGRVRVFRPGTGIQSQPYLDLTARVHSEGGEQGLLGLAFDPRFPTNGWVYVAFTRADGGLVLGRLTVRDRLRNPTADPRTLRTLLVVPHPTFTNHNGGSIAFTRKGYLLLGTGDGGGAGDPGDNARNPRSLSGKVLRLDVARRCPPKPYCVPPSNPFRGGAKGAPEVYLWGLRNPWRMSVDPATGDLWVGDVGQGRWEEVNRVPGGSRGRQLAWPCLGGEEQFDAARCPSRFGPSLLRPTAVFCHPDGVEGCAADRAGESVTGGYVYRGRAFRDLLGGAYVAGDFVTGNVWTVRGTAVSLVGSLPGVTSFGEDRSRELWAVTLAGGLHRMSASAGPT